MPSFIATALIDSLKKDVEQVMEHYAKLGSCTKDILLTQPAPGKWSIAQVLAHLNAYNRFYLAEIEKGLSNSKHKVSPKFKTGLFGNYFTNMMQPKEDKIPNKMKAPKDYAFGPELDVDKVMAEFAEGQKKLLLLLDKAKQADMNKIKLPISISKLIKLKLGDVFMFLIAHQQRHFVQIKNIEKALFA
jgi:hypothetical protein